MTLGLLLLVNLISTNILGIRIYFIRYEYLSECRMNTINNFMYFVLYM